MKKNHEIYLSPSSDVTNGQDVREALHLEVLIGLDAHLRIELVAKVLLEEARVRCLSRTPTDEVRLHHLAALQRQEMSLAALTRLGRLERLCRLIEHKLDDKHESIKMKFQ